jgi:hypothetical protein
MGEAKYIVRSWPKTPIILVVGLRPAAACRYLAHGRL